MSFKEKLSELTKIDSNLLPSSYQIIGDIFFLKLPKIKNTKQKKQIIEAIQTMLPYVKTVCEIKQISGEFRKPKLKILYGKSTKTIHKENGIFYKLDVSDIMFSKGNLLERKRLLNKIKPGEIIVDMFAGIGYFSLNLAKYTKAEKIYSIEKNKIAFEYLKKNIQLNKIKNIDPVYGDSKKVKIPQKADRVLMGYFPGTDKFLASAFGFLKDRGTIVYHNIFSKKELWNKPLEILEKAAKDNGFRLENVLEKKIVKDYAPNVYHVVVDAEFRKLVK